MIYEWYIDLYLLINFLMDAGLLWGLGKMFRIPVSGKRIMAGAAIGAVGGCLLQGFQLWTPGNGVVEALSTVLLLFLPAGMIYGCFGRRDGRTFLKLFLTLYFEAIFTGGVLEAAYQQMERRNLPFWAALFLVAGAFFLTRFFYFFYCDVKKEWRHCYPVVLKDHGQTVRVTGYLDTGNQLTRPEGAFPVHVVSEAVWQQLHGKSQEMIPFSTIGNPGGQIAVMQIEEMCLETGYGKKKVLEKPWIARAPFPISHGNRYQILLHGETDPESTMSQK